MKLVATFNEFLTDTVDLNETRISQLEQSIEALKNVLTASAWRDRFLSFAAQGSWAHKTIIKPLSGDSFDADLLVFVDPVDDWNAGDYIDDLYSIFHSLASYKDKVHRSSHCVTIDYAGDRKIDVAPCVFERRHRDTYEVCNRDTDEFETSRPLEYTQWLIDKNTAVGGNGLRKVTRLVKYLRDVKANFTCPSFLLTTMLGSRVLDGEGPSAAFADVPTALKTLIGRLDDWLKGNPRLPVIRNPVLYEEIQSDVWDETKYANFREKINLYRGWIDDAYGEADRSESIGKWQRVFGEQFAAGEVTQKAGSVSEAALAALRGNPLFTGVRDLVDLVKRIGGTGLPEGFDNLPHMRRPRWRAASGATLRVIVIAQLYTARDGQWLSTIADLSAVPAGRWLRFEARTHLGLPFPDGYATWWRVTNTDQVAERANALRGDFYRSDRDQERWEKLEYRGVHLVEAFVVRKADQQLLGKSAPFHVVIE